MTTGICREFAEHFRRVAIAGAVVCVVTQVAFDPQADRAAAGISAIARTSPAMRADSASKPACSGVSYVTGSPRRCASSAATQSQEGEAASCCAATHS